MQKILVLGAGQSSTSLISYLLSRSSEKNWKVVIAEMNISLAKNKFPQAEIIDFDISNDEKSRNIIKGYDLVISMLPARFHINVARICAEKGIHMLTASYNTDEIMSLDDKFKENGKLCLMEMGLDPGIDHMSAMKVLDQIKGNGYELTSFETFTGGLLDMDHSVDNPWHYKFTWNPRNVVIAGNGHVKFKQEGRFKYIPYHRLFQRTEVIHIPGYGYFEGYANRDSLKYIDLYDLRDIRTLYRGTLRRPGFCKAWDIFIQLGATDDSYKMENVSHMTHRQFINSFLQFNPHDSVELKLAHYLNIGLESEEMYKLKWLGVFNEEIVGIEEGTPAQILEHILKKKWTLNNKDRDLIVMWHKFDFMENGIPKQIQAHMVVKGKDEINTGMSMSVGFPLAVSAELILKNQISVTGVQIPTNKNIYVPVLDRLEKMGFEFMEREMDILKTA